MQFSAVELKDENGKSLQESESNWIIERGLKSRYIAPIQKKNKWDMIMCYFSFLNALEPMNVQCSCSWILIAV